MATISATTSAYEQLTANTVDTVTLDHDFDTVVVINRDGSAEIFFTVGSADSPPATPTVGGDGTYLLPAAIGSAKVTVPGSGKTIVKLKSAGTPTYGVSPA